MAVVHFILNVSTRHDVTTPDTTVYFSIPSISDSSCNTPAIRCYGYTLSAGAEEVAAHPRRSTDFAMTSVDPANE